MYEHLDFENYTRVEHGHLVIPLPDEKYKKLSDIYNRVCAVIYFSSNIGSGSNKYIVNDKVHSEAMIRAALCEWVSIEDCISIVYPKYKGIWFDEHRNKNPILHMFKLLRNYNVHIDTSKIEKHSMRVKLPFGDEEYDIEKEYIANLNFQDLSKLKTAKKYMNYLQSMISVFDEQQRKWGIAELIIKYTLDNMVSLDVLLED